MKTKSIALCIVAIALIACSSSDPNEPENPPVVGMCVPEGCGGPTTSKFCGDVEDRRMQTVCWHELADGTRFYCAGCGEKYECSQATQEFMAACGAMVKP